MSEPLRKKQKLQESGHQHRKTPPAGSSTLKTQGSLERWLKKNTETQISSPHPRPPQGLESLCPSDGEQNPATSAPETGIEPTPSGSDPEELQGRRTSKITHFFTKAPGKAACSSAVSIKRTEGLALIEKVKKNLTEVCGMLMLLMMMMMRARLSAWRIKHTDNRKRSFFGRFLKSAKSAAAGKEYSTDVPWLGVPLSDLQREPECSGPLPALRATDRHTVLIRTDLLCPGEAPVPFPSPDKRRDRWDNTHVKMPCSDQSLFPVEQTTLQSRWDLIKKALNGPFRSSHDVKDAVLKYNAGHAKQWSFTALHSYFKGLQESESAQMFAELLPAMAQLALRATSLLTQPLPLLTAQHHRSITLSQEQVSCLLANAFFCTFPRRNSRRSEYSNYPDINFSRLFEGSSRAKQEKLKTLLCYFKRVTQRRPGGLVTYTRQCLQRLPAWSSSEKQFRRLHICCDGTIEEQGYGMLQVDFANRFVGGGVTGSGLVQEEIRFLINPELIAARLFTEALEDNECLIITGTEQFSRYSGYSDTYRWDGNHDDQTPRDEWLRRRTEIVAIDALHYRSFLQQFQPDCMTRELNKAYCGFTRPGVQSENLSAVATGNWGCGVFGGDTRLKALLQMMAAAEADRDLMYFTFGDVDLLRDVHRIHTLITHTQATVGSVFSVLLDYYECVCKETPRGKAQETLYSFLSERL